MPGLSTADGFMSVKEGVDDMIKYLANEPSVGLYFVQQHAQTSMPYLLDVKEKVVEKIHDVSLHIEDIEDSIDVVRSMTEFGYPLAEEMIKDINTSLLIVSKCQPKRGLILNATSSDQTNSSGSNAASIAFRSNLRNDGSGGYFSAVLNSAKQKAAGFRLPPINYPMKDDQLVLSPLRSPASDASAPHGAEAEELPVSGSFEIGETRTEPLVGRISNPLRDYGEFNNDREANFEAWLQESEQQYKFLKSGD
ncbi:hypothetical protein KSP39_PZI014902 [Platanthera zijinensis]|uniref:Uncharacterized protein n=1 Tax=Platanthera zijinensis TaxID=2320716 RepID=A0AAP0BAV2_9ASPA